MAEKQKHIRSWPDGSSENIGTDSWDDEFWRDMVTFEYCDRFRVEHKQRSLRNQWMEVRDEDT